MRQRQMRRLLTIAGAFLLVSAPAKADNVYLFVMGRAGGETAITYMPMESVEQYEPAGFKLLDSSQKGDIRRRIEGAEAIECLKGR